MTHRDIRWQLPITYSADICAKISWDAQIYLHCARCGCEYRVDGAFAPVTDGPSKLSCRACKVQSLTLVRHLEIYLYQCMDCQHFSEGATHGFEELTCQSCGSSSIRIPHRKIEPPFPESFHELLAQKEHPWGVSGSEDLQRVLEEFKFTAMLPEPGLHAQIYSRFCERLHRYSNYSQSDVLHLKNAQGLILKEYFRSSGDLAAGLECVRISEECAKESPEPLNQALMKHNVAMDIFSVLIRCPEKLLERVARRDKIRRDGVRAAEDALSGMRIHLPQNHPQYPTQIARILHILGDLLRIKGATVSELEQAVSYLTEALSLPDLEPRLIANISESRALAIGDLPDPTPGQTRLALRDLELSASRDESTRIQAERWTASANLGLLYLKLGEASRSIGHLEQAADLVLQDLGKTLNESELLDKTANYVGIFEALARAYALNQQPAKALDAIEILRSGRLHIQAMSPQQQTERTKTAAAAATRDFAAAIFGTKPSHTKVAKFEIASAMGHTTELARHLAEVPTRILTYSVHDLVVTCLSADARRESGSMTDGGWNVTSLQWQIPNEVLGIIRRFAEVDAFSARTELLENSEEILHEAFVAPVMRQLRDSGVVRLGICVPRSMSPFSLECVGARDRMIDSFDAFSLPSSFAGNDLVQRDRCTTEARRVLIVEYGREDLPHAREEADALGEIWGDAAVRIPASTVTKSRVLQALEDRWSFIHFACPADFDPIQPRESALFVAGYELPAERIIAGEIARIRLQCAPVITLSSCPSTLTSYGLANDCVGIPGSLLLCGARGVVGARWPVYDKAPTTFMIQYHKRLRYAEADPIHSLCDVKRDLSRSTRFEQWAAFGYLGVP